MRDWDDEKVPWAAYIHPVSRRIYSHLEAVEIARFNKMQDIPLEACCRRTYEIQKILEDQKIDPQQDMDLYLDFVTEGKETHFYRFNRVEYKV